MQVEAINTMRADDIPPNRRSPSGSNLDAADQFVEPRAARKLAVAKGPILVSMA